MVKEKKTFIIYKQYEPLIKSLSDDKAGKMFKALFDYSNGEEVNIPKSINGVFLVIKQSIDDNDAKWEETRRKRQEAGSKGGKAKASNAKHNQAKSSTAKQSQANLAVNGNVNANAIVNANANVYGDKSLSSSDETSRESDLINPDDAFELFWKTYPKRTEKWKCIDWFKSNYELLTEDFIENMINKIEQFKKNSEQWNQDGDRFIPYPLKWLESAGWDDELTDWEVREKCQDPNGGFEHL